MSADDPSPPPAGVRGAPPDTLEPPDRPTAVDADQPGIERLLALSDGVVAIALTLLVLQLRVPAIADLHDPHSASQLANELGQEGNQLLSYLIAFYVIAQYWLAHHRIFRQMTGHHEGLAWWNFAFLMTITLMPFTSALLGQFGSNPLAIDIFALNLLLASVSSTLTMLYARHAGLLVPNLDSAALRAGQARTMALSVAVVLSMGIAWIDTTAAKLTWLLIAALPFVTRRWVERLPA